jgi:hypothetical protein
MDRVLLKTQPLAGFFILQVYGLRYVFFERELRIAFYCQALLVLLDYQRRLENISGISKAPRERLPPTQSRKVRESRVPKKTKKLRL